LQGVLTGRRRSERDDKPLEPVLAVDKVATDLMPFFGEKFNRRMVPLQRIVASQNAEDTAHGIWLRVWNLIRGAETEARSRLGSVELPRRPKQVM
jgi:hypothetical protein